MPTGVYERPAKAACSLCESPARARGLCSRHYKRWQTYGDPNRPMADRREVALAAVTPEVRERMGASARNRRYKRELCAGEGCDRTVTRMSRSGLCKRCAQRAWKKANPDKVLAAQLRYQAAHPDKVRKWRDVWRERNPHATAEIAQTRRARKRGQFVEKVYKSEVYRRDEGICGICEHAVDPDDWHLDHVIPLARGGEHSYANTQVAHPACNVRKAARLAEEMNA